MKIGRADIAGAMIRAARFAPSGSVWDVVPGKLPAAAGWWKAGREPSLIEARTV
jgi:hypothetical protein